MINFSKRILILTIIIGPLASMLSSMAHAKAQKKRSRSDYERSVLSLSITKAVPDPDSPWAIQNSDVAGHAGVVVGDNLVLTQASVVSRAVYIQAQKVDDVSKIPMRVVFADYDANLAILTPLEGYNLGQTRILPLGPDIPVGSDVTVISIENERHLQLASMRILDVNVREAMVGGTTVPMYSLGGQARSSCRSDLAVRDGLLIGICVGVVDQQPQIITSGIIAHFIADKHSGDGYRGFGSFGATLLPVTSPWHRKTLGLEDGKGALRVAVINETSPFADCLSVDDIVLGIDQINVDHRGFFMHSQWGAVPLRNYIVTKYAGDPVAIRFQRKSEVKICSRRLRRYSSSDYLVAGQTTQGPVSHMIFGGLIFRELNVDFLTMFGRDWQNNSPASLLFVYNYQNKPSLTRRREIVLANVLGDVFNAGYEKLAYLILDAVNGKRVNSLDEMRLQLKAGGVLREGMEFAQFDFKDGTQVVLPYAELDETHQRIARTYAVTDPNSFFKK
jgi:S1-C subfamily serine protease